jgi:hypothetical protein
MSYGSNSLKGRFQPKFPKKYKGDHTNVIYRSSWERKFMEWADRTENVKFWNSEEIVIPYLSPIDGKYHRYFVDFKVWIQRNNGKIEVYLVEIKPLSMCTPPKKRKQTKSYIEEVVRWGINEAKWNAANEYALDRGEKFIIMTERELGIK